MSELWAWISEAPASSTWNVSAAIWSGLRGTLGFFSGEVTPLIAHSMITALRSLAIAHLRGARRSYHHRRPGLRCRLGRRAPRPWPRGRDLGSHTRTWNAAGAERSASTCWRVPIVEAVYA